MRRLRHHAEMKPFHLIVGLPFVVIMTFFSGSLPYTLVYQEASLMDLSFEGEEPLSAGVVRCDVQDTAGLFLSAPMKTTFRVTLQNHTDRFVVISALGEVFDPKGRSAGIHSQLFVLNPDSVEENIFRSKTPYTGPGKYRCKLRYAIGRLD
jgi:hypothetical protein